MEEKTVTELIPKDDYSLIDEYLKYWESIKEINITNDSENNIAAKHRSNLSKYIKELEDRKKELTKPYKEPAKIIDNEYKEVVGKLKNGKIVLGKAMAIYEMEKERKRIALQNKLDAEAEEKRRKAQQAAQLEIEKAGKYRKEGKDFLADQAEARAEGHLENEKNTVSREVVTQKPAKTSFRKYYVVEITNFEKAVNGCMIRQDLRKFLVIDEKGLADLQKVYDGSLVVEGIRFIKKLSAISRSA